MTMFDAEQLARVRAILRTAEAQNAAAPPEVDEVTRVIIDNLHLQLAALPISTLTSTPEMLEVYYAWVALVMRLCPDDFVRV